MLKIRNYFIALAVVFAISSAYTLVGVQDAKAQDAALGDLIKRIESLESKGSGGNVSAGKIRGLKIGFDIRHRYENMSQGFAATTGRTYTRAADGSVALSGMGGQADSSRRNALDFTLQRVKLSFDADVNKNVMARIELQDSRTFGEEGGNAGTAGNLQRTDVQEAYVQLRGLGDINPLLSNVQLRIGRWQQGYGDHRLIGTLGWANQSRSYDGAKVMYNNNKNFWVDVFAWQIAENTTGGVDGGGVLSTTPSLTLRDTVMYGFYSQYKFGGFMKGNLIEPYMIVKAESSERSTALAPTTQGLENEQRYTLGFRAAGKDIAGLGGFDYTVEPAWQMGKSEYTANTATATLGVNRSEQIQAFAIYAGAGYTFKNIPWTPRIGYAYSFASGDDSFDVGNKNTFDQLSPTQHAHNGYIDAIGWQNMKDHQIHLNLKPTKKLVIDTKIHIIDLDEEADGWYGVGGTSTPFIQGADTVVDPATGVSRNVDDELGQEVDVTLKYNLFENFGVVAGYSHFWAGDFIEDTGANNGTGVDWFYLQTTVKF